MRLIVQLDHHDGKEPSTFTSDDFHLTVEFTLEALNKWPDATIDVFNDLIKPDTRMFFAWRAGTMVYVVGRTITGGVLDEAIDLLDLQSGGDAVAP